MIVSYKWYNRLGNNIIQLINIIDIALLYKHNIVFKTNLIFFNLRFLENIFKQYNNNDIITDKYNFHNYTNRYKIKLSNKNIKIRNNLLKKAFLIKDIQKIYEDDVVLHIRSGDIFSLNPPEKYTPPPLIYYTHLLDKYKYKKIIIVCEDRINPVVNKLLKMYKNSVHNINSLENDIKLILGATNVISSVGTFVHNLMIFSKYNKNYFKPNKKKLKNYYTYMNCWKNTKNQVDYMMTYKEKILN